jgi:hypothetical protein
MHSGRNKEPRLDAGRLVYYIGKYSSKSGGDWLYSRTFSSFHKTFILSRLKTHVVKDSSLLLKKSEGRVVLCNPSIISDNGTVRKRRSYSLLYFSIRLRILFSK